MDDKVHLLCWQHMLEAESLLRDASGYTHDSSIRASLLAEAAIHAQLACVDRAVSDAARLNEPGYTFV